jgi:BTB And C-terminal Kelch
LEQQIWNLIQNGEKFQESDAYLLYLEAKYCRCEKVQHMMMSRVQKFFMTVVCSEEFLTMEPHEIHSWLKLDSIGINSEVDVFYSAARWLLHDWEIRKDYLISLMKLVRFGLIEPWRIVEYRMNKNMGKLTELLINDQLQCMLETSLSYAAYRNSCNNDSSERFAGKSELTK